MSKKTTTGPSVRACAPLFELLKDCCGGCDKAAALLWMQAFGFKFDGNNPVNIPDREGKATAAGWVDGATRLMRALIDSGIFEK